MIEQDASIYLRKRNENDIWKGLYEFPLIENLSKLSDELLHQKLYDLGLSFHTKSSYKKHLLSHQTLYGCAVKCSPKKGFSETTLKKEFGDVFLAKTNDLEPFAFPKLIEYLMDFDKN